MIFHYQVCVCVFSALLSFVFITELSKKKFIPSHRIFFLIYSRKLMLVMVSLGTQNLQQHASLSIFQLISKELTLLQSFKMLTYLPGPPDLLVPRCPSQIFRLWQSKVELCLQDTMQYISWGLTPTVVILPFLHSLDFYLLLNFHNIPFICK